MGEIVELQQKHKCRNCEHTWDVVPGVIQIICPECKSIDITRPYQKTPNDDGD